MAPGLMGRDTALAGDLAVFLPAHRGEPALLFFFLHRFLLVANSFLTFDG
jgi:hypothetical protein